jgi:glycosyltransferase involved in cell wall biosynthesis
MRIAHLNWIALPTPGGVPVHIDALVARLRQLGLTTEVFSGTRDALDAHYQEALDMQAPPSDEPRALAALIHAVRDFDLVQIHNSHTHRQPLIQRLIDGLLALPRPPRILHDIHGVTENAVEWELLRYRGLPMIVHSRYIAHEVLQRIPTAEVHEQLLSLTLNERPYTFPPHSGTLILQPTRLSRWKGSAVSLRAVLDLLEAGREDFTFVQAGSASRLWPTGLDDALLARAAPWRERGRIHFVQYSPEESWDAIRQADFVLHPTADGGSHGEPFSLATAQAIILGTPVIATESGHLPILLQDFGPKQIIALNDVDALREAIARWLDHGVPRATAADRDYGEALRQSFLRSAQDHIGLYERLLSRRAS